ncbi:helix-turn-helix transcriptional regulator [Chloroflexia bacterium SDU3-3]|nr:helix-turn-helix transcriptional regulator [Chloroflexia bacterium SDU3-3]
MDEPTFGIAQTLTDLDTGWKSFPGHYLLYAADGAFLLEAGEAQWRLPPQRAALIAAETPIRLRSSGAVACHSVLFAPGDMPPPARPCCVFAVTPVLREMLRYSARWGRGRCPDDAQAARFFAALADMGSEAAAQPAPFWLPRPRSPELARAMAYALAHLGGPLSAAGAAQAAGVSERTLLRRFEAETQMTWRVFLGRARMIRAMELLERGSLPVIEVAYAVGFASPAAFSAAFRAFTGQTPRDYAGKRF